MPRKRKYSKDKCSLEIGNLIKGNSQSKTPHEKWFIDISQKRYLSGIIYLVAIKDAATRVVVGYASGGRPDSELVLRAPVMATFGYATNEKWREVMRAIYAGPRSPLAIVPG